MRYPRAAQGEGKNHETRDFEHHDTQRFNHKCLGRWGKADTAFRSGAPHRARVRASQFAVCSDSTTATPFRGTRARFANGLHRTRFVAASIGERNQIKSFSRRDDQCNFSVCGLERALRCRQHLIRTQQALRCVVQGAQTDAVRCWREQCWSVRVGLEGQTLRVKLPQRGFRQLRTAQ
jgi:hypothetical protein